MIWYLILIFEIISIVIYGIMHISDSFQTVIPNYGIKKDRLDEFGQKVPMLCLMAFLGGWLFAPYFIYLAYKWYKLNQNK